MTDTPGFDIACPLQLHDYPHVLLAHGGGGRLMNDLIERMFRAAFNDGESAPPHDAATLAPPAGRLAMTTDSFVVSPLFFPGGDIGSLAVHGTVNDLAMAGARPLALTAGFILEEGLAMEDLWLIVRSMAVAAEEVDVRVVAGDTKVVDRGKGDGVFINTTGLGVLEHDLDIGPASVRPGDRVILSGDLGRHGIAIMAQRQGLEFETVIESDGQPLWSPVQALLEAAVHIHCLRDLTRGGLSSALNEIAAGARAGIHVRARDIPVDPQVRGACEILGFDPLYVANEGRFIAIVPAAETDRALAVLRTMPASAGAVCIGLVTDAPAAQVTLESDIGATRILDMLSGEQLPRIC